MPTMINVLKDISNEYDLDLIHRKHKEAPAHKEAQYTDLPDDLVKCFHGTYNPIDRA